MSAKRPPKSPHDAFHGSMNRSALHPNHHANPANTAESRISAARAATSQTATGAESSFFAPAMGGDGTPATFGCAGTLGAGVVAVAAGAGVVAAGAGVGVEGVGAALGVVGVGAGAGAAAGFLPQSAPRS